MNGQIRTKWLFSFSVIYLKAFHGTWYSSSLKVQFSTHSICCTAKTEEMNSIFLLTSAAFSPAWAGSKCWQWIDESLTCLCSVLKAGERHWGREVRNLWKPVRCEKGSWEDAWPRKDCSSVCSWGLHVLYLISFLTCSVFNLEKQKMEGDLWKFCFLGRMPRALLLLVHESHLKWPNCSVVWKCVLLRGEIALFSRKEIVS